MNRPERLTAAGHGGPLDDLTSLRIFVHVVESGGFSSAARVLGVMPATISKHVALLETRLKVRLLNRTTRTVTITEAGQRLYERSKRVLQELSNATAELAEMHSEPTGLLRVTVPPLLGLYRVVPNLPAFLRQYPGITLDMSFNASTVDIARERVDVALRIAEVIPPNLIALQLAPYERVVVASPAYLRDRGTPTEPQQLLEHNCLVSGAEQGHDWQFRVDGAVERVRVVGNLAADNAEALRRAALAGLGITMTSRWFIQDELRSGQLVPLLADHMPQDHRAVYAVLTQRTDSSRKLCCFVDFLKSCFAGL